MDPSGALVCACTHLTTFLGFLVEFVTTMECSNFKLLAQLSEAADVSPGEAAVRLALPLALLVLVVGIAALAIARDRGFGFWAHVPSIYFRDDQRYTPPPFNLCREVHAFLFAVEHPRLLLHRITDGVDPLVLFTDLLEVVVPTPATH